MSGSCGAWAVNCKKAGREMGPERGGKGGTMLERASVEAAAEGDHEFKAHSRLALKASPSLEGEGNLLFLIT